MICPLVIKMLLGSFLTAKGVRHGVWMKTGLSAELFFGVDEVAVDKSAGVLGGFT